MWQIAAFKFVQKTFVMEMIEHEKALGMRPNTFWPVLVFFKEEQLFFVTVEKRFVLVFIKLGFVVFQLVEQVFSKASGPVVAVGDSVVDP